MRAKPLVISGWLLVCLITAEGLGFGAEVRAGDEGTSKATVVGRVCDPRNTPLANITVEFFQFTGPPENNPDGGGKTVTDERGEYKFSMAAGRPSMIQAGGPMATMARSEAFKAEGPENFRVPDLVVRPARMELSGVILDEAGKPAADLKFRAQHGGLENFKPMAPLVTRGEYGYSKTGSGGEFHLPHVLEDEPVTLWAIGEDGDARIWRNLLPGSTGLRLSMAEAEKVELSEAQKNRPFLEQNLIFVDRATRHWAVPGGVVRFRLPDLDGKLVSLEDEAFKNKVVLVNIWGSWCPDCQLELPHLIELQKKYGRDRLVVIGVAFEREDTPTRMNAKLREAVKKFGLNYPVLLGGTMNKANVPNAIAGLDVFSWYPTTLFIGRDGRVRDVQKGFYAATPEIVRWQVSEMERKIQRLLLPMGTD